MTKTLWDTAAGDFRGGIPADAESVLWYWDGRYANGGAARARFPHLFATGQEIGLTDLLTPPAVRNAAPGCDSERGNGGIDRALEFAVQSARHGNHRPVLYSDLSDMNAMIPGLRRLYGRSLDAPGPTRPVRLYPAHPGSRLGLHICGPHTCGQLPIEADGAQTWWGSIEGGGHVDEDHGLVRDDFFPAPNSDPMLYARYDHVLRTRPIAGIRPVMTERLAVETYDRMRGDAASHAAQLDHLRAHDLRYYMLRLEQLMSRRPPRGHQYNCTSPQSKDNHWCWRHYRLAHRVGGHVVKA